MDVVTREPLALWSDAEEEGELLHLPLALEPQQEEPQAEGAAEADDDEEEDGDEDDEAGPSRRGGKRKADDLEDADD